MQIIKSALITGVTGQDGKYLAELLLAKGYFIIGAVRNMAKASASLPSKIMSQVELVEWDMLDQTALMNILIRYRPTEL
ncbi:GDP-mannose 4,6-dehydratase [Shewanella sp.]|uniref:GDP-mannose 4,6-dehydratase n=1 Tax=Shewanella sp. TaxID=50422 RepID=UPI004048DD93